MRRPAGVEKGHPSSGVDVKTSTTSELIFACGWCGRVRIGDGWIDLGDAVDLMQHLELPLLPKLTHGVCEACAKKLWKELDEYKRKSARTRSAEASRLRKKEMAN